MSRDSERWVREVSAGLRHAPATVATELRSFGERARESVRRRARGGIKDSIQVREVDGKVEVFSNHPGAAPLETGETIHGSPWLAIPLFGTNVAGGPRSDPMGLFVIRSRGELFLASRSSGQLWVRWKLQATVQPRHAPFFRPGVEEARADFPQRALAALTAEVAP